MKVEIMIFLRKKIITIITNSASVILNMPIRLKLNENSYFSVKLLSVLSHRKHLQTKDETNNIQMIRIPQSRVGDC